jgi:hypothetical protein
MGRLERDILAFTRVGKVFGEIFKLIRRAQLVIGELC